MRRHPERSARLQYSDRFFCGRASAQSKSRRFAGVRARSRDPERSRRVPAVDLRGAMVVPMLKKGSPLPRLRLAPVLREACGEGGTGFSPRWSEADPRVSVHIESRVPLRGTPLFREDVSPSALPTISQPSWRCLTSRPGLVIRGVMGWCRHDQLGTATLHLATIWLWAASLR